MEAENQPCAEKYVYGRRQGQPLPTNPPQYTPTANTQMQPQYTPTAEQQQQQQQQQQPGQFQGFPPYGPSTSAAASPYYAAPPGAGYAGGYGVPPVSHQQQQVTVVTANQAPTVVQSFTGAMIYSCFVFWCLWGLCGLIGFILAGE